MMPFDWISRSRLPALVFLSAILILAPAPRLGAQPIAKIVDIEAGYGYISSSAGSSPSSASGLITGLRYGYLILDRPEMSAVLSLALGYTLFPEGTGSSAVSSLVYGLEYEHSFFRRSPVALSVEYGLLFDLIFDGGRAGYAYGNHTRLGLGPDLRLSDKDDAELLADYNILDLPYFELSSSMISYPSLALRYRHRL